MNSVLLLFRDCSFSCFKINRDYPACFEVFEQTLLAVWVQPGEQISFLPATAVTQPAVLTLNCSFSRAGCNG